MKDKIVKLNNGGVLIYGHTNLCKSSAVEVGFSVGANNEKKMGTAHLLEHTLFKKTKNRSNAQVESDRSKISFLNASTSMDYIVVKFFRTNKLIAKTFDFANDILMNSVVDDEYFETEKEVVKEELAMCQDNESRDAYVKNFKQAVSGAKAASDIVGGKEANIDKIKFSDLQNFKDKNFVGNNFVCSVVSNLSLFKVKRLVNNYFAKNIPFKENFVKEDSYFEKAKIDKDSSLKIFEVKQERVSVLLSFKIDKTELEIFGGNFNYLFLSKYLSGSQGELFLRLRNKGLIYRIDSDISCFCNGSLFNIFFETSKDKIKQIIDEISSEIQKIAKDGVDEIYTKTFKSNLEYMADEKLPSKTTSRCHINLSDYLSFGKIFHLSKREKKILRNGVNSNEVKKVAREIFCENGKMYVTIVGIVEKNQVPTLGEFKKKFLIWRETNDK